ncbi:DUF4167 domain-containing protein [Rhodobacteraceae bacterium CCMM004]|nr:DUF4167 domain-containing protein [Rhodobacteraceae bacterium CCMM004]
MRSSKSRSRSKSNRNRPSGNIVNRVFDSSGPEGKVRGTPQQIIDKYNQLARDAQLSGDRVATENFQQHAEHYTRMLAEAHREQEARREQQEAQQRERQQRQQDQNQGGGNGNGGGAAQDGNGNGNGDAGQPSGEAAPPSDARSDDVIDVGGGDSGLVETPESKPARRPRTRKPRGAPKDDGAQTGGTDASDAAEAAE